MTTPQPELTPQQLDLLRGVIETRVGLHYGGSRRDSLRRALITRFPQCGVSDWKAYARLLASGNPSQGEFRQLLRLIAITETGFFRIPAHFKALRDVLIPAIIAECPAGTLNIWSAGCSTGEEPYSIAMALAGAAMRGRRIDMLATDLSADVLERAREARYGERAVRGVPRGRLPRYFCRRTEGYDVKPEIRRAVTFAPFNLASLTYPRPHGAGWDIIFCRNVLMYFRPRTAQQALARLRLALRPGGFLILGPAESPSPGSGLEAVAASGAFVYVRPPVPTSLRPLRRPTADPSVAASLSKRSPPTSRSAIERVWPTPGSSGRPRANDDAACAKALGLIAEDRWEEAERALVNGDGARPGSGSRSFRLRLLLAWVRAARGHADQAAADCRELLSEDSLLAPAHYILGTVACRGQMLKAGVEHFGRAIYIHDGFVPAHYHLGIAHSSLHHPAAASRAFRAALLALDEGRDGWHDFAEGLSPSQWRQACEERLASLADCK